MAPFALLDLVLPSLSDVRIVTPVLPLTQFGVFVLTTSAGIMDHEEARRKKVGGKVGIIVATPRSSPCACADVLRAVDVPATAALVAQRPLWCSEPRT